MAGPPVYTVESANELVPHFEQAFTRLDSFREHMKALKIKLTALEMIWGPAVNEKDCPDHQEGQALLEQMKETQEEFQAVVVELGELGAQVKDMDEGLVDLYHVHDGRLVFLCWKRGEECFEHWHHVDEGFAERQPLGED